MPIDTVHPQVSQALPDWQMVRDCLAGERTMKEAGELYLPKLSLQKPEEYEKYKARATYLNATGRTQEAIMGLIFRKPPQIDLPPELSDLVSDADLHGKSLVAYARQLASELTGTGRCGTLVDYSRAEKRPYFAHYVAEDIINWRVERVAAEGGGRNLLTLLTLREKYELPGDPFNPTTVDAWRVYRLEPTGVSATLYRLDEAKEGNFIVIEDRTPTRRGEPLKEIPFVFHNAYEPGPSIGKSPMLDIASVNVAHYRQSADYENGLHLCGIPTPYFFGAGADEDEEPLYLGASAWTSNDPNASAGFIEFTGQGLSAIAASLTAKEGQMAALGARLIEPRQADAEAYATVALRSAAEGSTLARIGQQATEGIVAAIAWAAWWRGEAVDLITAADGWNFALNADFTSTAITPEQLNAWITARSSNLVSEELLQHALKRGEAYPDGWTEEQEVASRDTKPPMPPPLPGQPPTSK